MSDLYRYTCFGLTLASNLPLPRLAAASPSAEPDTHIALGPVAAQLDTFTRKISIEISPGAAQTAPPASFDADAGTGYHFHYWNGIEVALDCTARQLSVQIPDSLDSAEGARLLLGPIMGLLLRLRGKLVLHASVININDRAIALLAPSGGGKSTTAAWMASEGYPVLSDDILCLDLTGDNHYLAQPGYPDLRLLPETAAALEPGCDLPKVSPEGEKRLLQFERLGYKTNCSPAPLLALYTSAEARDGAGPPRVLPPHAALLQLIQHGFPGRWYPLPMRRRSDELQALAHLAERIPLFELNYRRGMHLLPTLCNQLIDHVAAL